MSDNIRKLTQEEIEWIKADASRQTVMFGDWSGNPRTDGPHVFADLPDGSRQELTRVGDEWFVSPLPSGKS